MLDGFKDEVVTGVQSYDYGRVPSLFLPYGKYAFYVWLAYGVALYNSY